MKTFDSLQVGELTTRKEFLSCCTNNEHNKMSQLLVTFLLLVVVIAFTLALVEDVNLGDRLEVTSSESVYKYSSLSQGSDEYLTLQFELSTASSLFVTLTNTTFQPLTGLASNYEALYMFELSEEAVYDPHNVTFEFQYDELTEELYAPSTIVFAALVNGVWMLSGQVDTGSKLASVKTGSSTLFPSGQTSVVFAVLAREPSGACQWQSNELYKWSSSVTWNGTVPEAGDVVTIPEGMSVLLDVVDLPAFAGIKIPKSSNLIIDNQPIQLTTGYIYVEGGLFAGQITDECRITNNIVITLNSTEEEPMGEKYGTQFIAVAPGGRLSLFGLQTIGRTKLAATVSSGSSTVTLADGVDWKVGQTVIITPTNFDATESAEFKIASIPDNQTLVLDSATTATYFGESDSNFDERAEVAVLDRKIKIQGVSSLGGHIFIEGPSSIVDISGVELYRMGQFGKDRRYPINFDSAGMPLSAFIAESTVHHSFRCLGLRNTQGVIFLNNLCYGIQGHAIYQAEGSEYGNMFEGNLISFVTPGVNVTAYPKHHDATPSGFFILHPNNTFTNNQVSGTLGHGFWFALPAEVLGDSRSLPQFSEVKPNKFDLGTFAYNAARSIAINGLHVDNGLDSTGNPTIPGYSPAASAVFAYVTATKCRKYGIHTRGGTHIIFGAKVANTWGGIHMVNSPISDDNNRQLVTESLIRLVTSNSPDTPAQEASSNLASIPRRGVHTDGGINSVSAKFEGFIAPDACFSPRGYEYVSSVNKWVNVDCEGQNLVFMSNETDAERFFAAQRVTDGTPEAIVAKSDFMAANPIFECTSLSQYANKCSPGSHMQVRLYDDDSANTVYPAIMLSDSGSLLPHVEVSRYDATGTKAMETITGLNNPSAPNKKYVYPMNVPILSNEGFNVLFKHQTPQKLRVVVDYAINPATAILTFCYHPSQAAIQSITKNGTPLAKTTSITDFSANPGTKYLLSTEGRLTISAAQLGGDGINSVPTTYMITSSNSFTDSYNCFGQDPSGSTTLSSSNPATASSQVNDQSDNVSTGLSIHGHTVVPLLCLISVIVTLLTTSYYL